MEGNPIIYGIDKCNEALGDNALCTTMLPAVSQVQGKNKFLFTSGKLHDHNNKNNNNYDFVELESLPFTMVL